MKNPDIIKFLHKLLLLPIFGVLVSSCSDDEGVKGPVTIQLWDLVTYQGLTDDGSSSCFTFRQVDDSPTITLTSASRFSDEVESGTRMIIRYVPESGKAYTSGAIRLLSADRITQGPVATEWKDQFNDWNRDKVFLYSVWRSGTYLNFHLRLTYDTEPRLFQLAADPATLDSDWPEIYLIHVMARPVDYHDRIYFASFDIAEIWNRDNVKGIRLHVANANLDQHEFTFVKDI